MPCPRVEDQRHVRARAPPRETRATPRSAPPDRRRAWSSPRTRVAATPPTCPARRCPGSEAARCGRRCCCRPPAPRGPSARTTDGTANTTNARTATTSVPHCSHRIALPHVPGHTSALSVSPPTCPRGISPIRAFRYPDRRGRRHRHRSRLQTRYETQAAKGPVHHRPDPVIRGRPIYPSRRRVAPPSKHGATGELTRTIPAARGQGLPIATLSTMTAPRKEVAHRMRIRSR